MKNKKRKTMKTITKLIVLLLALFIFTIPALAQKNKKESLDSPCINSTATIDVSSLESILLRTAEILDNPDEFWKNDGAYDLAKKWHDINKISIDTLNYYNSWIEHLEEINNLTEVQKQSHSSFKLMNEIIQKKEVFDEYALPHICSFLPKNDVNLNTTVYLTGHTLAWAFMTHSEIVINVLHSHYKGRSANDFMNIAVHEAFHIGYGKNRSYRKEIELENLSMYNILDSFHNEGMATYVGYKAQDFFPAHDEKDYIMLEDTNEVKRLMKLLNDFLQKAKTLSDDELWSKAWEIGTTQRAYYVVGSFMAKTIDEKSGRRSLIETIENGPMSFISIYNKLVNPELQMYEFKLPNTLSDYQSLKQAVLNNDLKSFNDLKKKMIESNKQANLEGKINSLGYNMLHRSEDEWAIRVFSLNVEFFPESANAYDSLGEAYLKNGDTELAIKNYRKSLELNPENTNAKEILEELEK